VIAVVYALIAALGYGVSDFYGALAARRIGAVAATLASYLSGVLVLGVAVFIIPGAWSRDAVVFGALAGIAVAFGFLAFYAAFAMGPVVILAPLIAVLYAVVPVSWALARGEELPTIAWVGVGLGLVAVLALSVSIPGETERAEQRSAPPRPVALLLGVVAALGMGGAAIALDYAPKDSGLSSALIETVVAVIVVAVAYAFVRRPVRDAGDRRAAGVALASGVLLAVGNGLFVLALQRGSLALVAVLVSLYPLATILLARIVLREHVSKVQWFGVVLAVIAAALMGMG
jgi:drug/metabolite transporter (DMT)-like permease